MTSNYIFVGPQGSGKGTQAKIIATKYNLCHISTGDLLRNAQGELKEKADEYMLSGKLVPDEIVLSLLKEKLQSSGCENGFILDGFPRNITQAEQLDKITKIDAVFNIVISDDEAIKRLEGRRNCPSCGANYNIVTAPKPNVDNICDICQSKLVKREDDNEQAIKNRLEIYHKETSPILKHYNTIPVNGEQDIDKVTEDILKAIKMLNFFK
ncbi:MAG: nucleoside monophosphate kinase [Candidatus Pacearchaeota archaeon]|jgi:adenylate kinase